MLFGRVWGSLRDGILMGEVDNSRKAVTTHLYFLLPPSIFNWRFNMISSLLFPASWCQVVLSLIWWTVSSQTIYQENSFSIKLLLRRHFATDMRNVPNTWYLSSFYSAISLNVIPSKSTYFPSSVFLAMLFLIVCINIIIFCPFIYWNFLLNLYLPIWIINTKLTNHTNKNHKEL